MSLVERPWSRPWAMRAPVVGLAMAVAVLGAVAGIGALLPERSHLPKAALPNGLIAAAANPWTYGGGENGDIYILAEGTAPRRIIGSDDDGLAQQCPRFSPDGGRLAYGESLASGPVTSYRGVWPVSDRAIVVVGLDAKGDTTGPLLRIALPTGPGIIACPEWSPTGESVAFRVGADLWIADTTSGPLQAQTLLDDRDP